MLEATIAPRIYFNPRSFWRHWHTPLYYRPEAIRSSAIQASSNVHDCDELIIWSRIERGGVDAPLKDKRRNDEVSEKPRHQFK